MTNLKIYPTFYESAVSLTLVVRGLDNERKGRICQASPVDLEPLIRTWLADKGFKTDEDLLRLAEATGSLRYGIFVLSLTLPRRKGKETLPRKVSASRTKQRDVVPREILDKVRLLREEICGHQWTDVEPIFEAVETPVDNGDQDLITTGPALSEIFIETETEAIFQAVEIPAGNKDDQDVSSTGLALSEILSERDSPISFKVRFGLMAGHRYQINSTGSRKSFSIRHCAISFTMTEPVENGFFWVKAEISPQGERHPLAWATNVPDQDPGARLAFRNYHKDADNNETWSTYPSCSTQETCCQANILVDAFEGDTYIDICQKPRRHVYIDDRNNGLIKKYSQLVPFVRGAYTGNDMLMTPAQSRLQWMKRKGRCNNPDTGKKKKRQGE
ncbi:hypothetical protein BJY00DRAFT_316803 [Aspergillus carlsbadensis]|nr:hypothetical protein BJY00DRAFT_316803 [Aspergillus carlsbadensis]